MLLRPLDQCQNVSDRLYMNAHRVRWQAFGWHVIVIDGHDLLIDTYGISARHIAAAVTNRQNV